MLTYDDLVRGMVTLHPRHRLRVITAPTREINSLYGRDMIALCAEKYVVPASEQASARRAATFLTEALRKKTNLVLFAEKHKADPLRVVIAIRTPLDHEPDGSVCAWVAVAEDN